MELCTTQSLSIFPKCSPQRPLSSAPKPPSLSSKPKSLAPASSAASTPVRNGTLGFLSVPRATAPEESSTGASLYATEERDSAVVVEVDPSIEKRVYNESRATGAPLDDSPVDEQVNGFLDNLNISGLELWADNWEYFDSEDTYSILLYGGGALLALWLASAIVVLLILFHWTDDKDLFGSSKAKSDSKLEKLDFRESVMDKKLLYKEMPSAPPISSTVNMEQSNTVLNGTGNGIPDPSERFAAGKEVNVPTSSLPARLPTFHASAQGPWCAVISYDACVRLCLHSWAKGCAEDAPYFLSDECASLRNSFGLQQVLLQSEEELLAKRSSELISEGAAPKSKKTFGKMKVQVRKVKMGLEPPAGCSFSSLNPSTLKLEPLRQQLSILNSTLHTGWEAVRKVRVTPHIPPNGSISQQSLAYMRASTQYIKQVSRLLRHGVTTSRNSPSPYEVEQGTDIHVHDEVEKFFEEDSVRMQPGSGETHMFFPDNHSDDLIIEVQDSKIRHCGRVLAQVAAIADDPSDKLRWWPIYHEPEHELVGRIQLYINYSTTPDESNHPKCGCVAETVAYDFVLEVAMKVQHFQQRNLFLHGPWKWLVAEFASYYGVSDAYTKLRYLSYIMDVATPTKDCLDLVYDLLEPVIMKGKRKSVLSHQENRILGEVEGQIQQILVLVFENYKSLDEEAPSGMMDIFGPATGLAAPALTPAVKLYTLLHDVLSSEAQLKFCKYFQVKWSGVKTQHSTTPFVDEMYAQLKDTLNEYEVIISRWPEYIVILENAIVVVEKAIIEALDKQYADFLSPLKDSLAPKVFGLKYVQKFAKRTGEIYFVPDETKMQSATKLKSIIRDSKETLVESDLRNRMQPLQGLLIKTIDHLQSVVEPHVFIAICRGFWDRMGQVVTFGSHAILDDIFASQMQQLLGNALQEKDLEPPRSIMEARSVLCKDAINNQDNNYYY
ncbi:hypothetical protein GH714_017082 [Hevea brasiliensis]|uniref:Uncharacterized protein n=1 Tax=Hevea brasiliensis TaxID=3981 RepID=A0A6A6K5V1_HEVBR|nr:hypothetical protein GH714_017082 [Hevea brasiliensis]